MGKVQRDTLLSLEGAPRKGMRAHYTPVSHATDEKLAGT